jgi:MoaA/NifB/PqqE/SkfB family radical SAM enzyme
LPFAARLSRWMGRTGIRIESNRLAIWSNNLSSANMPTLGVRFRRSLVAARRRVREGLMVAKGLRSTDHPVLAHIVPTRRCNLSCTYCNEFDDVSKPVPAAEMSRRIDLLADLGTSIIAFSGGEPLLHPELDDLIVHIRRRGAIAGMITNGLLLTADRIQRLNRAGLEHMQISIDNVEPDKVSKKSLKVLDLKLRLLAEHAEFHVNINSVVGGGIRHPHDAIEVAKRAVELGFTSSVGIIHDSDGQLQPLSEEEQSIFLRVRDMGKKNYARMNYFQDNIAAGKENKWKCRSGARYLYICEDGLVHYCSQQRGYPARIHHRKGLRTAMHSGVRSLHFVHGFLAGAADDSRTGRGTAG